MKINIFGPEGLVNKLFGKQTEDTPEQLYNKARALFDEGNSGDGYVYLQAAAIKGHAEASFQMGSAILEQKTFGTKEDAVKYLTIASDNGHAFATTNLASCYQMGTGTKVDYPKAIHLLNKAIKLGDEMAAFNLAQTYLLGVGVEQDEKKGWGMLESLAAKGNENARLYMNKLLSQGYKAPELDPVEVSASQIKVDEETKEHEIDHAPEGHINDKKILALYHSALKGDDSAKEKLMELGGNQMNRDAMNALRKLGLIKEDVSVDFKRGTIEYIAKAWKTYNVEPLYVVCAWTFPGFIYREYKNGKTLFETKSEDFFIERISDEFSKCVKERIVPKFRLREVNNSSSYCVDVLIPSISLSTFYLDIQDDHFKGMYRIYDDTSV